MAKVLSMKPAVMPIAQAKKMVSELQSGDDEWRYEVEPVDSELAKIAIYDEDDYKMYWTEV